MSKTLSEKIYKELEETKKELAKVESQKDDMLEQMSTLAEDLQGVSMIIQYMLSFENQNNASKRTLSAFNNILRLIDDISASLEATSNGKNFYTN